MEKAILANGGGLMKTTRLLELLCATILPVLALSQPAKADLIIDDPTFRESLALGNTCATSCASVTTGTDPLSGKTTLEYIFGSTASGAVTAPIPVVVAGDLEITENGSSTVGDVIRFENISGTAVAFIFSSDIAGGLTADVGLPSFQDNNFTVSESSAGSSTLYTPTSTEPGFCKNTNGTSCSSAKAYQLQGSIDAVPEPSALVVLGTALMGIVLFRRRRRVGF